MKAYPFGKVPNNRKKIADLQKLSVYTLDYRAVLDYSEFYNMILSWPTSKVERSVDPVYEER